MIDLIIGLGVTAVAFSIMALMVGAGGAWNRRDDPPEPLTPDEVRQIGEVIERINNGTAASVDVRHPPDESR